MGWRSTKTLISAVALIAALIPVPMAAAVEGPPDVAYAAASTIPGLYAVSELVTTGITFPPGVTIDPMTGFVWVADGAFDTVTAYDHSGGLVDSIDSPGNGTGQVDGPMAVRFSEDEVFVVESSNNRVQVFDRAGNHIRMWGTNGSAAGQFSAPCGLDIVGNLVYVADAGNDRVQVFNKDNGAFINQFGSLGSGNGELTLGCSGANITHFGGEIFVVDKVNDRIAVFDGAGNWQRNFGAGTLTEPIDVHATPDGRIWVSDYGNDNVTIWSPTGTPLDSFGTQGSVLGTLDGPGGIAVDPSGDTIWVAEFTNNRLQVFTTRLCSGKTLTHVGTSYNDTFTTGSGDDVVRLGLGDDTISTGRGADTVCGGGGDDVIRLGPGADLANGEHDNDTIFGGGGRDTLRGAEGNDKLWGGGGFDNLEGGAGRDIAHGQDGNDRAYGGGGNDKLFGEAGIDRLFGQAGNDTIRGDNGDDRLYGNAGNDDLTGNRNDDTLNGGPGTDVCRGNTGTDTASACETIFGVP